MCCNLPCYVWLEIFNDCYEYHHDGLQLKMKGSKNKTILSGSYHLKEWPCRGGVFEQDNRVVEIFRIVRDEYRRILGAKVG